MSAFGDKLHALLTRLKGGEELAQHEVETLVEEFITHVTPVAEKFRTDVAQELSSAITEIRRDFDAAVAEIIRQLKPSDAPQGDSGVTASTEGETPAAQPVDTATPAE